jgi:hypothetical protein
MYWFLCSVYISLLLLHISQYEYEYITDSWAQSTFYNFFGFGFQGSRVKHADSKKYISYVILFIYLHILDQTY